MQSRVQLFNNPEVSKIDNSCSMDYSCLFSAMQVILSARLVDPNSPVAQHVAVNWVAIFAIWPWKKWPPQSCSRADINPPVVVSPSYTQRKQTTKKLVNSGHILAPVQEPVVNGRDHWNKSCHTLCKSTNPSQLYREKISSSWPQISTYQALLIGS